MVDKEAMVKVVGDATAGAVTIGTVLQVLPAIAALVSILWTLGRIYEMLSGKKIQDTEFARWLLRKE